MMKFILLALAGIAVVLSFVQNDDGLLAIAAGCLVFYHFFVIEDKLDELLEKDKS